MSENKGGAPLGNTNAVGQKGKMFTSAVKRCIARHGAAHDKGNPEPLRAGLDMLAEKLVTAALAGEQWAIIEIANRLEGKPAQSIEVSGDEERPVKLGVVCLVRPD